MTENRRGSRSATDPVRDAFMRGSRILSAAILLDESRVVGWSSQGDDSRVHYAASYWESSIDIPGDKTAAQRLAGEVSWAEGLGRKFDEDIVSQVGRVVLDHPEQCVVLLGGDMRVDDCGRIDSDCTTRTVVSWAIGVVPPRSTWAEPL